MKDESSDDAVRSLFHRTQPTPVNVDVASIVARQKNEHVVRKVVAMTIRISAFVAVAGSLAYVLLGPLLGSGSVALAEVKTQVEQARSVEYIETSYAGPETGSDSQESTISDAGLTLSDVLSKLEQSLKTAEGDLKKEIAFQIDVFNNLSEQGPRLLGVRRVRIKGKHLERTDDLFTRTWESDYALPTYHIRNATNGLWVGFSPREKKRTVLRKQVAIKKNGEQTETDIEIPASVDFFARFRSLPSDATQELGEKTISGQTVTGYRSVETHRGETWTRTYWISTKSKLPVEIITERHKDEKLEQRWVKNRFEFDRELPDELFSTDAPEDYQSEDGKVIGLAL